MGSIPSRAPPALLVLGELLAEVWCTEADARRRLGDLEGAGRALEQAGECMEVEPLDAPVRAMYCYRLGLLHSDRGEADVALALLGRAVELWEELHELGALGQAHLARGWLYLMHEEPAAALQALQAALCLVEPTRSPRAALRARYALALAYADLGRQSEAEGALQRARALLEQLGGTCQEPGYPWLEAMVLERSGRIGEAAEMHGRRLEALLGTGAYYEALIAAVDLARCQAAREEWKAAARQALQKALDLAEPAGVSPPVRAAVAFAGRFALAAKRADPSGLPSALVSFLHRAEHRPALQFSAGGPVYAALAWDDLEISLRRKLCRAAGLARTLAEPAAGLDTYARELLRLTAEEIVQISLTFLPPASEMEP